MSDLYVRQLEYELQNEKKSNAAIRTERADLIVKFTNQVLEKNEEIVRIRIELERTNEMWRTVKAERDNLKLELDDAKNQLREKDLWIRELEAQNFRSAK